MENNNEKVFFNAGDIVRVKQNIDAPDMVVKHVNKVHERNGDLKSNILLGVTCFWFTKDNNYQSQLFSTKDLRHVK
jgi:hypothetical protein